MQILQNVTFLGRNWHIMGKDYIFWQKMIKKTSASEIDFNLGNDYPFGGENISSYPQKG